MLDRSRPFAEVYPHSYYAFEQDNKLFNSAGEEVAMRNEPEPVAPDVDEDTVRRIDLRKRENKHLRPSQRHAV